MPISIVFGSGGREHAICSSLSKSPKISKIYCIPGNAGTALEKKCENLSISPIKDIKKILELSPDFAVIGPEVLLAEGLADLLEENKIPVIGFPKKTARLETSKDFARKFADRFNVSSPEYKIFTDYKKANEFLERNFDKKYFIKAEELCGGKGAIPAANLTEGKAAVKKLMVEKFCGIGKKVIVEEWLIGREATIMAFYDGKAQKFMEVSTDHKRLLDNDAGPNTGGMGAIAPSPFITKKTFEIFKKTIAEPTLRGMKKEKLKGKGIIFYGLIISEQGIPKLIEYNMRFGDPECQTVLYLLKNDLYDIFNAMIKGRLISKRLSFNKQTAITVMLATKNYPYSYKKDIHKVTGLRVASKHAKIFHAATFEKEGKIFTSGGRIFAITAIGNTISTARKRAYKAASLIKFQGKQYRKDIGLR